MVNSSPKIVAIDGPSASGKGTIARKLAEHFGFAHLDTGLLYRAVGFGVLSAGGDPSDPELAEQAALALAMDLNGLRNVHPGNAIESMVEAKIATINFTKLMGEEVLRGDTASTAASKAAAIPVVRGALLKFQKDYCASPPEGKPGAVLDGRDIGTVIAPHAQVKIFVTASAEARAERRFKELQSRGQTILYADVLADMKSRDQRDADRTVAPTKPAHDATMLDTTSLDAAQSLAFALDICLKKLSL